MINWEEVIRLADKNNYIPDRRVEKSEAEWAQLLTNEEFRITRRRGTERAFSGQYCEAHAMGSYSCKCCGEPLFDSKLKYDSRSGWPSFTEPVKKNVIKYIKDFSHGMTRVEVVCNICDAHLGHVFPDGPQPTGLRYCINSLSLTKDPT